MTARHVRHIVLGRPSAARLDAMIVRSAAYGVDYDHVGSTLEPTRWPDRTMHEERLLLGHGDDCFHAAVTGLRTWACHRGVHARIHPPNAPLEVGTDLMVVLPAGPCSIIVPDRVVVVLDEHDRFGFAYGTLPGHQERGEEAFLVERLEDGSVRATVRVDAVVATRAARLVAPAVIWFQHVAVRRYLAALARDVRTRLDTAPPDEGGPLQ